MVALHRQPRSSRLPRPHGSGHGLAADDQGADSGAGAGEDGDRRGSHAGRAGGGDAVDHGVIGRYAPSPTGMIHAGNARTALAAWLSVRSRGGTFVWRVEDLDGPRVVPGMAEAQMADLAWLGLDWDEGPDVGGPFTPYAQSERSAVYEEALRRLAAAGRLFPCRLSRRDLQAMASAPHGAEETPYPASLRPRELASGWFE